MLDMMVLSPDLVVLAVALASLANHPVSAAVTKLS